MAFLIISIYVHYKNQIHSDKLFDIEDRLNKLENRISKLYYYMTKDAGEMKYIDSNTYDIQKEKTDTLR